MAKYHNDEVRVYRIPLNIFDGGTFFGFPRRRVFEVILFAFLPGFILWQALSFVENFTWRLLPVIIICGPIAFAAGVGYNRQSLTQFLMTYIRFRKKRRVLEFSIPEEDFDEGGPFDEQEKRISELENIYSNTKSKTEKKRIKNEVAGLKKALTLEKAELQKQERAEDADKKKQRDIRRKEQIKEADRLAMEEYKRLISQGEKANKSKLIKKFREKHVSELPSVSGLSDKKGVNLSAQDFIPIDRIEDRCIVTTDGRYLRVMCVNPINFPKLSTETQNDVIDGFATLLKGAPANIHIKTMAKSADIEAFIERMYEKLEQETDPKCREMMLDYIATLRKNATGNAVSRQFFVIVEYDENMARRDTTVDDRKRFLEVTVSKLKQHFRFCNNSVIEFSDITDEVDFIYRMFYDLLGRFNTFGLSYYDKLDFSYGQVAANPTRSARAVDFIAPIVLDLSHRKYVVIDGVYYGYMYIPKEKFRNTVGGSWLFGLINAGGGIDVDIFYKRYRRDEIRGKARRTKNFTLGLLDSMKINTNTDTFDNMTSRAQSTSYVIDGTSADGGEDFFDVVVLITVIAMTEKMLFERMDSITSLMEDADMGAVGCDFQQEVAFLASLPLCAPPDALFDMAHRNMLTYAAAATYPTASYEMMDDNGILMGINIDNYSLVMPDVFDTRRYRNANMYIVGSSGAGKSYNLILQALRSRQTGVQTFILAPLKGFEFMRSCEAIGGQYIKIAPGSPHCINIMAIRKKDEEAMEISRLLDGGSDESILSQKISSLETLFVIMIPDLTFEEEQLLNHYMVLTYKRFGITSDNESLNDPNRPGFYKKMPTLSDLFKEMEQDPQMKRVRNCMSKYVTGSAKNFSEPTNVDLENPYTVIDVSSLNKKMMPIGMFIALDFMWDKIKEDRTRKKRLFIDEIWHLMGRDAPEISAQFVMEIFKTIRGFGGGAVAATQELGDFFALRDGVYGKAILNACTLGMIMKLETPELKVVTEHLDLELHEQAAIKNFVQGNALIRGGVASVAVKILGSTMEHDLITTKSDELLRIVKEKKAAEVGLETESIEDEQERLLARAELEAFNSRREGLVVPENVKIEFEAQTSENMTRGEIIAASKREEKQFEPPGRKKVNL